MATINLDKKDGQQNTLGYIITAEKQPYKGFRMFEKVTYKEIGGEYFKLLGLCKTGFNGKIFIEYTYNIYERDPDYVEYITAYYYRYNNNFPLFLEFHRYGITRCYKCSEISKNGPNLYKLTKEFIKSEKFSDDLITENDLLNGTLTYRLDKKQDYNNIKIETILNFYDYVKITHKAKDEKIKENQPCILYDKYLFEIKSTKQINLYEDDEDFPKVTSIQGKNFNSINVYYRKKDEDDRIPLLVECIERNNNIKHYFSRKNQYEKRWNIDKLENDDYDFQESGTKSDEEKLKDKLDLLEFQIKHSVLILLHKKSHYKKGEMDPTVDYTKNIYPQKEINIRERKKTDTVYVQEEKTDINSNYKCYKHDLESYTEYKNKKHNRTFGDIDIIVLKFFISTGCIEIYDKDPSIPILYIPKVPLYVYFYKDDHFPLLIKYNNDVYKPTSKEKYLVEWEKVKNLEDNIKKSDLFDGNIIKILEEINSMLNEIDIQKTSDYGVDDYLYDDTEEYYNLESYNKDKLFNFTRIKVNKYNYGIYKKFTHVTKNGFGIGLFRFNKRSALKNKETIGDKAISFSVYYFMYDAISNKNNPLILELELDSNSFKYYILETNGSQFYEYKLELSNGLRIKKDELINILDHQNFILNKVISILLENKYSYTCCNLKNKSNCIKFFKKHQHNFCYINCNNKIIPADQEIPRFIQVETIKNDTLFKSKNYVLIKHSLDISQSYFTIPASASAELIERFRNFTINKIIIGDKKINLKYKNEIKDRLFKTRAAYIHFYKTDERPLLVYCNNVIFYPKSLEKYYDEWEATDHDIFYRYRDRTYFFIFLEYKLNEIYYNINPVYLNKIDNYTLDNYFKKPTIIVKVENLKNFKKFTHTTSDEYKLGVAKYYSYFIIGNYESYNFKSSELKSISAYYQNNDIKYLYPLLIEFKFKGNNDNKYEFYEFYELESTNPYKWKKINDKNFSYLENKKYTYLLYLSNVFIKGSSILIQTEDSLKLDNEEIYFSERNDEYDHRPYVNDFVMEQPHPFNNFSPKDIIFDLPLQTQSNCKSDIKETARHQPYIYDTYDDEFCFYKDNQYDIYKNLVNLETIDFRITEEMFDKRDDLETGRTNYSEEIDTKNILRKLNTDEPSSMMDTKAEASTGEVSSSSNSSNSCLGPILGMFGSLLFIGLAAYPAYKFYKKFKIKDMRPIF